MVVWRKWVQTVTDFVFPPVCAGCGKVGSLFCETCYQQVQWVGSEVCPRCGQLVDDWQMMGCWRCAKRPLTTDQLLTAVYFSPPIPQLVHKFKYMGHFALAETLGAMMMQAWQTAVPSITPTAIVPIPLHPKRHQKRGYNQAELLANVVSHALACPLQPQWLRRVRHTSPQVDLNAQQRQQNIQDAFQSDLDLTGQTILLIDDVCTTGATLSDGARALKKQGAINIIGFCLARAV